MALTAESSFFVVYFRLCTNFFTCMFSRALESGKFGCPGPKSRYCYPPLQDDAMLVSFSVRNCSRF